MTLLPRSLVAPSLWALTVLGTAACSSDEGSGDGDASGGNAATAVGGGVGSGGDALGSGGDTLGSGGGTASGGAIGSGGTSTGGAPAGSGGLASGGSTDGSGGDPGGSGGDPSTCTPDPNCKPAPPDTGDFNEDCVARVNQFRACMCLPPLARNTDGEACASQQAQYDYDNDRAHAGIGAKICEPQSLNDAAQNECPGYPSVASTIGLCHQQMFDEGQCDDFATCGHYLNITNQRASSVSCGYYETPEGDVWMVQNFYF